MRWKLRLSEFNYDVLYRPSLLHQVPETIWRLLQSCKQQVLRAIWWWNLYPWVQQCRFWAATVIEGGLGAFLLDISFETNNMLTRSHTASQSPASDNLDNNFDAKFLMIDPCKRLIIWLFHSLHWSYWKATSMINSVDSSWPQQTVILTRISMKAALDSYAADTHPYFSKSDYQSISKK